MENSSTYSSIVGTKDLCNYSRQSTRHSALQDYNTYYKRRVLYCFVRDQLVPILMPYNGENPNSIVILGMLRQYHYFSKFFVVILRYIRLCTFFIYCLADNHPVHRLAEVRRLIIATGALLRFLPPYSVPGLKSSRNGYSQRQSSYPRTRSVVCTFNKTKRSSFTSSPSGDTGFL